MKYQYNYEFFNRNGKKITGHCMTVFDTYDAADKALCDRMSDLNEQGYDPQGEVVEVKEEEV